MNYVPGASVAIQLEYTVKLPRLCIGVLSAIWQLCAGMHGTGRSRIRMGMNEEQIRLMLSVYSVRVAKRGN